MHKNYFITFCCPEGRETLYMCRVPTLQKSRYIFSKFDSNLKVISLSSSKRIRFGNSSKTKYGVLKMLFSIGAKKKIGKKIDIFLRKIYLFFFFKFVVKKDDNVLLYHSFTYTKFISKFCSNKIKNVVLEVEEIYGYNAVEDKPYLEDELKHIKRFQKFIFVNDYIPIELNINSDCFAVSYGVINPFYQVKKKNQDGKIHVLYAGTIERKKLGAFSAVRCSQFLPTNYVMHIAGFGDKDCIDDLIKMIDDNNNVDGCCKIVFHGMLNGKNLDDLIDMCDIGLSSNIIRPNFVNNSFPSKTMVYMAHNLKIVSGYAEAFTHCKICRDWHYYYDFNPESIALTIKEVDVSIPTNNSILLKEIDDELVSFFKKEGFLS